MSNYTQSTNFATKDALTSGDPLKIVKGTEINTEFVNISTAIATKADLASPTLTGTPAAPTASSGTNTTQVATTAFVTAAVASGVTSALTSIYPVGSIYINAGVSTNPATLLGFGTWAAFGAGRVMVGLNASDALFDTLEETGGSKDTTLPIHSHTYSGTTSNHAGHQHAVDYPLDCTTNKQQFGVTTTSGFSTDTFCDTDGSSADVPLSQSAGSHTHTISGSTDTSGSADSNTNLQPYITVAMWKRTA